MAYSDIAYSTLVCSWLFTGLATISIIAQVLSVHRRRDIGIDDYLLFTAYFVSVLLVVQTTWAVVDEGQGEHEADVSHQSQFGIVAKVCPNTTPKYIRGKRLKQPYRVFSQMKYSGDGSTPSSDYLPFS